MSLINWVQYTEPVVAMGAPGFEDVTNRPLRQILTDSGLDPDADFAGFVSALNPTFTGNVAVDGNLGINGNLTVSGTAGFTGTATFNNVIISGTVGFTGNIEFPANVNVIGTLTVNTNKFSVEPTAGNTLIGGTLGVTGAITGGLYNSQTISSTANFTGTLNSTGDFSVATNKFNVTASNGNTTIAGTLGVTGVVTGGTYNGQTISSTASFTGTLNVVGNFSVNTNMFTVTASNGNTLVAGTLNVTSDFKVNTNKFIALAASGNTTIGGSLTFTTAASVIIPGATSFNITNNANSRNNLVILDAGGIALNTATGEVLNFSFTAQNGDMPSGALISNSSTISSHRALSIFANNGTPAITVGAYYFTNVAVETVWQYANALGKTIFQVLPKGGETSFGQNYAGSGTNVSRVRLYGTSTSNLGGTATLIVQQGGISTDSLVNTGDLTVGGRLLFTTAVSKIIPGATSISYRNNADSSDNLIILDNGNTTIRGTLTNTGLITGNAGITVASGQTLTLTGATVAGSPTWSSNQAITLSTAAQGNITSVGTLTSLIVSGLVTLNNQIKFSSNTGTSSPTGNGQFNLGTQTTIGVILTGQGSTSDFSFFNSSSVKFFDVPTGTTTVILSGSLQFSTTVTTIIPGATSISLRNNANSADNLIITDAGNVTIRGTTTVSAGFGVNGKTAQTSFASGGAVAATGSSNVAPFGYTTAAQADGIVTLVNNIRSALVANGIMS